MLEKNAEDEVLHISEHTCSNACGDALSWPAASSLYLDLFVSGTVMVLSPTQFINTIQVTVPLFNNFNTIQFRSIENIFLDVTGSTRSNKLINV